MNRTLESWFNLTESLELDDDEGLTPILMLLNFESADSSRIAHSVNWFVSVKTWNWKSVTIETKELPVHCLWTAFSDLDLTGDWEWALECWIGLVNDNRWPRNRLAGPFFVGTVETNKSPARCSRTTLLSLDLTAKLGIEVQIQLDVSDVLRKHVDF